VAHPGRDEQLGRSVHLDQDETISAGTQSDRHQLAQCEAVSNPACRRQRVGGRGYGYLGQNDSENPLPGTNAGRSSRMAAGAGTSVADKETLPTEPRPAQKQRAIKEKKPTEPDEDRLSNPAPKREGWEDPFDRSVTQ
jgi:hypothetical protein